MVLSIIAAIMSGPMIIMNSVAMASKTRSRQWHYQDEDLDEYKKAIIGRWLVVHLVRSGFWCLCLLYIVNE